MAFDVFNYVGIFYVCWEHTKWVVLFGMWSSSGGWTVDADGGWNTSRIWSVFRRYFIYWSQQNFVRCKQLLLNSTQLKYQTYRLTAIFFFWSNSSKAAFVSLKIKLFQIADSHFVKLDSGWNLHPNYIFQNFTYEPNLLHIWMFCVLFLFDIKFEWWKFVHSTPGFYVVPQPLWLL